MTDERTWVLIESGSNQDFIFRSNRQRYAVGASGLLKTLPTFVKEARARATAGSGQATLVVNTSSKALLLVDDPDVGRAIVSDVTMTALTKAPGMDVWGYVEPGGAVTMSEPMKRLDAVHAEHARLRGQRPSPHQRWPMHPFLDQCVTTGLPAVDLVAAPGTGRSSPGAPKVTASASATAVFAAAHTALKEFHSLGDAVLKDLSEEVRNAGWVAAIHADGNGVGSLITSIRDASTLTDFSRALESVTRAAFDAAVAAVTAVGSTEPPEPGWIVPLILGGDDVTVLCDARYAVDLVRCYLTEFESRAAADPTIRRVVGDGPALTAAAGIAAVKSKYPFHAAYVLAEELTHSAKAVKVQAPGRSAYDVHVLHDSVARPLRDIRGEAVSNWPTASGSVGPVTLYAGPFLAPSGTSSMAGNDWSELHEDRYVMEARDALCGPRDDRPLSGSAQHKLRAAILTGGAEPGRARAEVILRASAPAITEQFLDEVWDVGSTGDRHSRLLTVLDLVDIREGRAEGERPSGAHTKGGTR